MPDMNLFARMLHDLMGRPYDLGDRPWGEYLAESQARAQPQTAGQMPDISGIGLGRQAPLAKVADYGFDVKDETARQEKQAAADRAQQLKELARQAQLDELGSLVSDMPADKLLRIRAQASAKGRAGDLAYGGEPTAEDILRASQPTGGAFSQQEMMPELQSRLDDRDRWLADQPLRDAAFQASPEMARRDPAMADSAGRRLAELQAARAQEQQVANQTALIGALGRGGKIPFHQAMQMQAAGLNVPYEMRGMDPDAAKLRVEQILAENAKDLQMMQANPMTMADPRAQATLQYSMYVDKLGKLYMEQIASGADPDEVLQSLMSIINQEAINSGALAYWESIRQQGQQQAQPEGA